MRISETSFSQHNAQFSHAPRDRSRRGSRSVTPIRPDPLSSRDTDGRAGQHGDAGAIVLQVRKQPARRTCAGLEVLVRRHLDGRHSVWRGPQRLGSSMRPADPWTPPRRWSAADRGAP